MRKLLTIIAVAGLLAGLVALPASADGTYHSGHYAFAPVAGARLRSGFVENIHPNGPIIFAREQYVVNGAVPNTTYDVVLMIFPLDTSCTSTPIQMLTATITTNAAGNGTAYHVFTPADATGLHGLTIGGIWTLQANGTTVYTTGCGKVTLD
jgi:hypothetical protein